ncbi:hypothetical protein [Xanthomonas albilineans]|uniref:hypothetical protein n=1 Tax=Xanthomonas albilineans TaxID=29447 RepID=UPI0005F305F9|nr:hypothetical protein [Xanthomonas albilineans]
MTMELINELRSAAATLRTPFPADWTPTSDKAAADLLDRARKEIQQLQAAVARGATAGRHARRWKRRAKKAERRLRALPPAPPAWAMQPDPNLASMMERVIDLQAAMYRHINPQSETAVEPDGIKEKELVELVQKGTKAWADVPDNWLEDLRGEDITTTPKSEAPTTSPADWGPRDEIAMRALIGLLTSPEYFLKYQQDGKFLGLRNSKEVSDCAYAMADCMLEARGGAAMKPAAWEALTKDLRALVEEWCDRALSHLDAADPDDEDGVRLSNIMSAAVGGCARQLRAVLDGKGCPLAEKNQEALLRDAQRYRFIEKRAAGEPEDFAVVEDAAFATHRGCEHNFSLNIDAAMTAERETPR